MEKLDSAKDTQDTALLPAPLIKSKERVQKHGEVFTPDWMVKKMLGYPDIQEKLRDMHATFLEPSAGEGAFLTEILRQKLHYVNINPASRGVHWQYNTLWALLSIYGIELLPDNLKVARQAMLQVYLDNYKEKTGRELEPGSDLYKSVVKIIELNVVQGNALTHKNDEDKWITFSQWLQDGDHKRKIIRREFTYDSLFEKEEDFMGSLFGDEEEEVVLQMQDEHIPSLMKIWEEE